MVINRKFSRFFPVNNLEKLNAYSLPRSITPVDLHLDSNEGMRPQLADCLVKIASDPEIIRRYPNAFDLEQFLADRFNIKPSQVLVTAGADEAIDRICRASLGPGRAMVLPTPAFGMYRYYATLADGDIITVPWLEGAYPTQAVIDSLSDKTALVVIVSPNNPTGAVATADEIRRIADTASSSLILLDLAYVEFADDDPTTIALEYGNCVVIRSLSKALGLAGLRVGYALGSPEVVDWLRKSGGPYTVASVSLASAQAALISSETLDDYVREIREVRSKLYMTLTELGGRPCESQGNFVLCRFQEADWVYQGMRGMGISLRSFPDDMELSNAIRIGCPQPEQWDRLSHALRTVLSPQAILFDLDGVLVDVARSYRQAIIKTVESWGLEISNKEISHYKRLGNANNDWRLTQTILNNRGIDVSFDAVKQRFEQYYQGDDFISGLWETEYPLVPRAIIAEFKKRLKIAIVTGRPRHDTERFLNRFGLQDLFNAVICFEDAPAKPSPRPVTLALDRLGIERAWMVGDTVDDIRSARSAHVLPLGIVAPGEDSAEIPNCLLAAGAARVLKSIHELLEVLP